MFVVSSQVQTIFHWRGGGVTLDGIAFALLMIDIGSGVGGRIGAGVAVGGPTALRIAQPQSKRQKMIDSVLRNASPSFAAEAGK